MFSNALPHPLNRFADSFDPASVGLGTYAGAFIGDFYERCVMVYTIDQFSLWLQWTCCSYLDVIDDEYWVEQTVSWN
jgi:hypothetical protein